MTVNETDVTNAIHEDVRRMMQDKKPLRLTVINDAKYVELIENVNNRQSQEKVRKQSPPPDYELVAQKSTNVHGKRNCSE